MIPPASFDRHSVEPPPYLYKLRNPGHWRSYKQGFQASQCLAMLMKYMPKQKGTFLDAGCGHSPDARFAKTKFRFKQSLKVDLWEPYCGKDEDYFRKQMLRLEKNKVTFLRGDICELSKIVPPCSVDMICCNAMIDLLCPDDRYLFYKEAFLVLRPGGILGISAIFLKAGYGGWNDAASCRQERLNMYYAGFQQINEGLYYSFVLQKPMAEGDFTCAQDA